MDLFQLLGTISIKNSDANKALDETSEKGQKAESKLTKAFSAVGNGAVAVGKTIGAGMIAGGVAVAGLVTKSVQAYADYEQLVGGVETLFKDSANKVMGYANQAYKTAGLSANDYMETVTSFSAALLQSLGGDTAKAADYADMAIIDMADNANKMGSSMESIQNAYQGFAKQNYTMLDNLKLGYGGTKEEMARLLADAQAISGIEYDISSYADVVSAIHVIQTEMGITGTTAKEASSTISGSIATMKASWTNLMTAMSDENADFEGYVSNFVDSVATVADNLMPRITIALNGVVELIDQLAPVIIGKFPELLTALLPNVINTVTSLINALVNAFPGIVQAITSVLPALIRAFQDIFNALVNALPQILQVLVDGLHEIIPQLINALFTVFTTICESLPEILQIIITAIPNLIAQIVECLLDSVWDLFDGIMALVDGLIGMLPEIVPVLIEAVTEMVRLVFAYLPDIIPLIVEATLNIITLLTEQLPVLLPMLIEMLINIITMMTEQLPVIIPMLIDAAFTVVLALIDALPDILNALIDALPGILQAVWDAIVMVFENLPEWFTQLWEGVKEVFSSQWNAIKDVVTNVVNGIKNTMASVWDAIKNKISGVMNGIKTTINSVWNGIKSGVSTATNAVKSTISNVFDSIKSKVTTVWNGIKDGMTKPIETARDMIKGIVEKIKGFFNFDFKLPKIKLPHFGITPSGWKLSDLLDGVIPKLGIEWYAKGGIMKQPTLFDYNPATGSARVGGEAGDEAVAPIDTLQQYVKAAVKDENTSIIQKLQRIIDLLVQFFPDALDAMNQELVLDTGVLVAETADKYDEALGKIAIKKGRGR